MKELRESRQRNLISALLSGDRHPELNVLDRKALNEALTVRNVDTLVLSRRWIADNPDDAETLVKSAIAQNAAIEIANGGAGAELDEGCGGVAAKLRFSVREKQEEIVEEQPPMPRKKPARKRKNATV
jgi:peptide subunit release factor 1 (eRF1)